MLLKKHLKYLLALNIVFLASACNKDDTYDKSKAVSAFQIIDPIKVDKRLEKVKIKLPKQKNNNLWNGSGSAQNQRVENILKKFVFDEDSKELELKKVSSTWTGFKWGHSDRLVFAPIIKDDVVFLLNYRGIVSAYDIKSEKEIWDKRIFPKKFLENYQTPKIHLSNGKIFAIAGINKIVAVSEIDGSTIWSKDISSIPVSSPVSDGKRVYVTTSNNKLYVFDAETGELQWNHFGINRPTAIFGAADPVIYKDLVIVSYSSGEIYAIKKTGEVQWSQDLNINKATSSNFYLNDIDATPYVENGVVYSIGNGGLMMAIRIKDGNYLWKKQIAGIVDFWSAGEFLFVINNDNKLLAVSKKTGGIKWISQLPNLEKEKKPQTKIIYNGITMAGDKLLISNHQGKILVVSPIDGKIETVFKVGKRIFHQPVVVNDKIYLHGIGRFVFDLIEVE